MNELVSIITPCYNSAATIRETIRSVIAQSYVNWELLIIDDCSNDDSVKIIMEFMDTDSRIYYLKTEHPSGGPTLPRNVGIQAAKGRFIAFLDSDDIWLPNKLSTQLPLFINDNVAIVYSDYEKISEEGNRTGRIVKSDPYHHYKSLLCGNELGCLTVVYDTQKIGKRYFKFIGHEDYNLWLDILKEGFIAINTNICLALNRIRKGSVSSNKLRVIKWIWHIYRVEQKKTIWLSLYYSLSDLNKSLFKYLK